MAALSKEEGTAYFKGRARCKKKSQNWSGLGQGTPLISTALEFAVLLAGFLWTILLRRREKQSRQARCARDGGAC